MLGSVTRPDGKVVTFKYDALGRRIEKTFNGRVHRYLWDGDVVLHEWEYDETERPQPIVAENGEVSFDRPEPMDNLVTWVYDTDGYVPAAKLVNGKRYGIVSDYIGRPVQAYDEHGTLVWQADYDIYGNLLNLKGDRKFVPFRQLGQYEDEETGLYYNRFRYYDPNTGGYISQDPIGLASGEYNFYSYVHDSNGWVDLWGLSTFFTPTIFNAPSGNTHIVYQQKIDWNLTVKTSEGIKTNLEIAKMGRSPFVVKNGKYRQINLHHSKQNAKGSLFELSSATHHKYKGFNALHPFGNNKHPINPVFHNESWDTDRKAYWRQRAEAEIKARRSKVTCK